MPDHVRIKLFVYVFFIWMRFLP